jgi:hypothetical protein
MPYTKPTLKQRKVVEILTDTNSNHSTMKDVVLAAGYSLSQAEQPSVITGSRGFQMLLQDAGIDDNKLLKVLNEGLEANKIVGKTDIEYPDHAIRHKYLETSLRLKGLVKEDTSNTYNTFIQQNQLDVNSKDSRKMVDMTVDYLMEMTKSSNAKND